MAGDCPTRILTLRYICTIIPSGISSLFSRSHARSSLFVPVFLSSMLTSALCLARSLDACVAVRSSLFDGCFRHFERRRSVYRLVASIASLQCVVYVIMVLFLSSVIASCFYRAHRFSFFSHRRPVFARVFHHVILSSPLRHRSVFQVNR
jgi:hypothetical protein